MKHNNDNLDERQTAVKHKIGHQTFMLMVLLLWADMILPGFGVTWLVYPANIMMIITICLIVYVTRTIINNAYDSPQAQKGRSKASIAAAIALVIFVAALIAVVAVSLGKTAFGAAGGTEDYSAIILMAASLVGLAVIGITSLAKKHRETEE